MTDPTTPPPPPGGEQPSYQTPPAYQQPAYAAAQPAPGDYPGKTLGIVGLVFAFIASVVGIILSAIALSQSKAAGYQNTPAKIGLILSIVFTVLSLLVGVFYFLVFVSLIASSATYEVTVT